MTPRRENTSILDRNICHSFGAFGAFAPLAEDAFFRFRDAHNSLCAERLTNVAMGCAALNRIATHVVVPMIPPTGEPSAELRVWIELNDFIRERIHHNEACCTCQWKDRPMWEKAR